MANDNKVGFRKIEVKEGEGIENDSGVENTAEINAPTSAEAGSQLDVEKLEQALERSTAGLERKAEAESVGVEGGEGKVSEGDEGEGELASVVSPIQTSGAGVTQKEREKKIEKILEGDVAEMYLAMPENERREFKTKGEETSRKINNLIGGGKFKIKKVIDLIRAWLTLIPGVNKFFLEKEVKIKADEIARLNELNSK